jgi:hypothetical protein
MIYLALILTRNLESRETPTFHGENRGSNPRGDATS